MRDDAEHSYLRGGFDKNENNEETDNKDYTANHKNGVVNNGFVHSDDTDTGTLKEEHTTDQPADETTDINAPPLQNDQEPPVKENVRKRKSNVKLTKFNKIQNEAMVTSDYDECSPKSVTSSSSAFPQSVSSQESTQQKFQEEGLCELCGKQRKDSGYVGRNNNDHDGQWMLSTSGCSSNSIKKEEEDAWRFPLESFTSKRQGSKRKHRSVPRTLRSFYKSQDDLINQFEDVRLDLDDAMENAEDMKRLRKKASLFAKWTFFINFCLLIIKIVAVVLSGSISLISSLVDSAVDLLSGLVIWITTRLVKNTDRYRYPQGRAKLEPMAIVILSVIMSAASLQIVKESIMKLIGLCDHSQEPPLMDFITIGISCTTIVAKLILFLLCRRVPHPTVLALAQDHKNDVLFNTLAIGFGYIGSVQMQALSNIHELIYVDPIGALLLCVYIIHSWCSTGWTQIKLLIGHTASPEFLSKITWMAMDHHRKIKKVENVKAFHYGNNFLVQIDIALPSKMTLDEAIDISEPLQQKLERLPDVERAFVRLEHLEHFTSDVTGSYEVTDADDVRPNDVSVVKDVDNMNGIPYVKDVANINVPDINDVTTFVEKL